MSVPAILTLFKANDQSVLIVKLSDMISGAIVNSAVVTGTLYDLRTGDPVPFFIDVSFNYETGSEGNYRGFITKDFDPEPGPGYRLVLIAIDSSTQMTLSILCSVVVRSS